VLRNGRRLALTCGFSVRWPIGSGGYTRRDAGGREGNLLKPIPAGCRRWTEFRRKEDQFSGVIANPGALNLGRL
jgi:hypothetical protein